MITLETWSSKTADYPVRMQEWVDEFLTDLDPKHYSDDVWLLCSVLSVIETGVNLHTADTVFLLDNDWSPSSSHQTIMRISRASGTQKAAFTESYRFVQSSPLVPFASWFTAREVIREEVRKQAGYPSEEELAARNKAKQKEKQRRIAEEDELL